MRTRLLLSGSALLVPMLFSSQPAQAQRVSGDIRIRGGPISGQIRIRPDRYDYRYRPRVVRVDMLRWRDYGHRRNWLRDFRRDARVVVIYLDRRGGRYYDRFRPGLSEIRVFQRGGRYYRWDDDRWFDRGGRYDRDDRRFRGRDDDRYDDRYDGRDRRDDRYRRGGRDGRDW